MGRLVLAAVIILGLGYQLYSLNTGSSSANLGKGSGKSNKSWVKKAKWKTKRFFANLTQDEKSAIPEVPAPPVRCEVAGKLVFMHARDCISQGGRLL